MKSLVIYSSAGPLAVLFWLSLPFLVRGIWYLYRTNTIIKISFIILILKIYTCPGNLYPIFLQSERYLSKPMPPYKLVFIMVILRYLAIFINQHGHLHYGHLYHGHLYHGHLHHGDPQVLGHLQTNLQLHDVRLAANF